MKKAYKKAAYPFARFTGPRVGSLINRVGSNSQSNDFSQIFHAFSNSIGVNRNERETEVILFNISARVENFAGNVGDFLSQGAFNHFGGIHTLG